jgi:CRISPR/Cas system-associated endonuclease/helicase Cas3
MQSHKGYKLYSPIVKRAKLDAIDSPDFLFDESSTAWQISDEYVNYLKGLDRAKSDCLYVINEIRKLDYPGFTIRQKEILKLYEQGYKGVEISKRLSISKQRVSKALQIIKTKLQKLYHKINGGI